MKATLYRLPARNLLVIESESGVRIEYPATEVRGHQIAQDAGVQNLTFGRIEDVFVRRMNSKPSK